MCFTWEMFGLIVCVVVFCRVVESTTVLGRETRWKHKIVLNVLIFDIDASGCFRNFLKCLLLYSSAPRYRSGFIWLFSFLYKLFFHDKNFATFPTKKKKILRLSKYQTYQQYDIHYIIRHVTRHRKGYPSSCIVFLGAGTSAG